MGASKGGDFYFESSILSFSPTTDSSTSSPSSMPSESARGFGKVILSEFPIFTTFTLVPTPRIAGSIYLNMVYTQGYTSRQMQHVNNR